MANSNQRQNERGYGNSKMVEDRDRDVLEISADGAMKTVAMEDSMFQDISVTPRTNLIELKSNRNIVSSLRDIVETEVDGSSVTAAGGEYTLTASAANGIARLVSAEIGRYQPGYSAEAGIGIRCEGTLSGSQVQRWGYYDTDDGFLFGRDADGLFLAYRRDGDDTVVVRQADWNVDTMDGSEDTNNPSRHTLDVLSGNIYQIRFAWYGYGVIEWRVAHPDPRTGRQVLVTVHRFSPTGQNSTKNPNLPVTAEVDNGATAAAQNLYVAGRQFSIYGKYSPNRRVTAQARIGQGSIGTTFLPSVSLRRKSDGLGTSVKVEGIDIFTDNPVLVQVRINSTLTGTSYVTPDDYSANETAVEADDSATAVTGGEVVYSSIVDATGRGSNANGSARIPLVSLDFIRRQPVTVCLRSLSGTATVTTVFRVVEEW